MGYRSITVGGRPCRGSGISAMGQLTGCQVFDGTSARAGHVGHVLKCRNSPSKRYLPPILSERDP